MNQSQAQLDPQILRKIQYTYQSSQLAWLLEIVLFPQHYSFHHQPHKQILYRQLPNFHIILSCWLLFYYEKYPVFIIAYFVVNLFLFSKEKTHFF